MSLLDDHVRRFNDGVRSGDFAPMAAAFAEDAEMHFEGVPVDAEMRITQRNGQIQKLVVTFD